MFTGRERKLMERCRFLRNCLFMLVGMAVVFGGTLTARAAGPYRPYEGAKYVLSYNECVDEGGERYIEITGIQASAEDRKNLGRLVIPEKIDGVPVTSIGKFAFSGRSGLTGDLTLPSGLNSIKYGAFSGCSGLTGELTLPSGLMSIDDVAFSGCSGLTGELTLPSSLTSIGKHAFYDCSGLTDVTLPDGLTSIGDSAFSGCSGLAGELTLPSGLTSIGDSAFSGCRGLTGELTLPDGLTSVGKGVFWGCSGLTGVTLPDGLTSIGDWAFCGSMGLTGVTLPDGLTSIGEGAFYASGIADVVIPKRVTSIGRGAFQNCVLYGYRGSEAENYVKRSENAEYACTFSPLTYEIRFNGNGAADGAMSALTKCEVEKSYTLPANQFKRAGYSFTGWNTEKDGSGTAYKDKASVKDLTKENGAVVTLYAQWKGNRYSIAFNGNGATEGTMKTLENRQVGKSYTLPANKFKRTGYTFIGWNTKKGGTGTAYENKASVKDLTKKNGATVTLYAQWKKNSAVTYQIKFNGNGGTGKMSALKCKTGKSYQLPANAFQKQGYTFAGWNTKKDGTGKSFKNKASVKDLKKKNGAVVTLYAQWKPNTYTVKFDGNKATGGKMKDLENCRYDKSFKLTKSAYKRKGYTFAGWNTKKNGTGKSYKNGAQVKNLTAKNKGTVVLYAQWIKKK